MMPLEQIALIAEIASALVVALTLIFVTIQLRQNSVLLRTSAIQSASSQVEAIYHPLTTDPTLAAIFLKGGMNLDTLAPQESVRLTSWFITTMFTIQNWYLQTRQGVMDPVLLEKWSLTMTNLFRTFPGCMQLWEQRRFSFSDEFVEWVNKEVLPRESAPGYRPLGADVGKIHAG